MASSQQNAGLCCSLCRRIYKALVTLKCGHNFCQSCMVTELKEQEKVAFYTCPTCGKRFSSRPSLQLNGKPSDRARRLHFTQENSPVFCTYCPNTPAVQTCLRCEESLCEEHLKFHNKTHKLNHKLIRPTPLEDRRCPRHHKLLDYYCTEDDLCICHDCCLLGHHKGHAVEPLEEASKKKKEKMQNVVENLVLKRKVTSEKISRLSAHVTKEEKADSQEKQVINLFEGLTDQIQKVKMEFLRRMDTLKQRDQRLSKRIDSITELCNMDDPLEVLQSLALDGEEDESPWEVDDTGDPTFKEIDVNQLLLRLDVLKKLLNQQKPQTGSIGNHSVEEVSEENGHVDHGDVMDDVFEKHPNLTEVEVDPAINKGTHRLNINSAGLFCCRKTGLKFLVKCPMTIVYTMAENWSMPVNDRKKYEIKSPLYEIKTSAGPQDISAVYLPHFLHSKDFRKNKPYLNCAHFKDGVLNLVSPSRVESSHVVLKNTSYSSVGVLIESCHTRKRKQALSHGTVLVYCKPVTQNFLLHVYLVPMSKPKVKEAIQKKETRCGFRWIDKPSFIDFVEKNLSYNIDAAGGVIIRPKVLHCLYSATEHYPYAEVRVPENFTSVSLYICESGETDPIWTCVLEKEDLIENPEAPSASNSSPSHSKRAKTFLQNNHEQLCNRLGLLSPLLTSMVQKRIIMGHEEEHIKCQPISMEQNKSLLKMVTSKGAEEEFYKILKENDPCLVQSLEQPTMNTC